MDQNITDVLHYVSNKLDYKNIGMFARSQAASQILYLDDKMVRVRVVHSSATDAFENLRGLYPQEIKKMYKENLDEALIVSDPREVKGGPYAYSREFIEEAKHFWPKMKKNFPKINRISIFQGDADPETTVREAMEIYNSVGAPKELHVFSGVGHRYEGVEKEMTILTVSWFVRQFADLVK